mgnify:CR=1 FL=1
MNFNNFQNMCKEKWLSILMIELRKQITLK